jgi:hypothetical protein
MVSHTKEPWIQRGRDIWAETCPGSGGPNPQPPEGDKIGVFASQENSERAVACVNGCAGVPHPEAMPHALAQVAEAVALIRGGTAYERSHVEGILAEALAALGLGVERE